MAYTIHLFSTSYTSALYKPLWLWRLLHSEGCETVLCPLKEAPQHLHRGERENSSLYTGWTGPPFGSVTQRRHRIDSCTSDALRDAFVGWLMEIMSSEDAPLTYRMRDEPGLQPMTNFSPIWLPHRSSCHHIYSNEQYGRVDKVLRCSSSHTNTMQACQ